MGTGDMPPSNAQLVEGALVSLDVGPDAEPLLCRIVAFGGDNVVLAPRRTPDEDQQIALSQGVEAYLLVDAGNDVRALRCKPSQPTEAGDVVAAITDQFRLGQRRMFSRADLVLPGSVTPLDSGAPPRRPPGPAGGASGGRAPRGGGAGGGGGGRPKLVGGPPPATPS